MFIIHRGVLLVKFEVKIIEKVKLRFVGHIDSCRISAGRHEIFVNKSLHIPSKRRCLSTRLYGVISQTIKSLSSCPFVECDTDIYNLTRAKQYRIKTCQPCIKSYLLTRFDSHKCKRNRKYFVHFFDINDSPKLRLSHYV